jgi:hypothetical protein
MFAFKFGSVTISSDLTRNVIEILVRAKLAVGCIVDDAVANKIR